MVVEPALHRIEGEGRGMRIIVFGLEPVACVGAGSLLRTGGRRRADGRPASAAMPGAEGRLGEGSCVDAR